MKTLVVYYSFEGNTKFIADIIAKATDAEVIELVPAIQPNTHGFMKYFWGGKQVLMKEIPALMPLIKNPSEYELIIIGTPVWAFSCVPAVTAFLKNYHFTGKKIAIFCCHGGGKGKTLENMKEYLTGNQLIGETDFQEPLKDDVNKVIRKVNDWVKKWQVI